MDANMVQASSAGNKAFVKLKPYLFLAPLFLSMGLFKYIPFFDALLKAFYESNGANLNRFIGLENFINVFKDHSFYVSMGHIFIFTGSYLVISLTFPLLAAVGVSHLRNRKYQNISKTLFIVPMVVPVIITILLWKWIYEGEFGALNVFLRTIGLGHWTQAWLGNSSLALWSIIFIGFPWVSGLGLNISFLIYLAGLLAIPHEIYEVSRIEGISVWRRLLHIEMPLLRNQIKLVLVLTFIQQMESFENVFVLTDGGPGEATLTPALYLYKTGFEQNQLGYGSAIGVVLFATILIITVAVTKLIKPTDKID